MQNMQLIFHSAFVVPNSSTRVLSQLVVLVENVARDEGDEINCHSKWKIYSASCCCVRVLLPLIYYQYFYNANATRAVRRN